MDVSFRPPVEGEEATLAKAVKRVFADYPVPMEIDEAGFNEFLRVNDVVLGQSLLAISPDGDIVGTTFSGRRGERAWIGGTGLIPECRGRGIGMEMVRGQLAALKGAGARDVCLEVISTNTRAKRVYQAHGLGYRRDLFSFRHMAPSAPGGASDHLRFEACRPEDLKDMYRTDLPWQRMYESVKNLDDVRAFISLLMVDGGPTRSEGLSRGTDPLSDLYGPEGTPFLPDAADMEELTRPGGPEVEGYCVYREKEGWVAVLDLYSVSNAREVLGALVSMTGGKPVYATNVFDGPSVMAFESSGFEMWVSQHEMRSDL